MPDQFDPDPLLLPGKSPADPAQAAGFLGGGAAHFLGIPEAVQALRGQMTPEEAQQFAVLAGLSMVLGMRGEGLAAREVAHLARFGKAGAAWNPTKQHPFTETPRIQGGPFGPANTTIAGPHMEWKAGKKPLAFDEVWPRSVTSEDVPRSLPTPIPERALAAGFNVPLAHGTRNTGTPFSEFKLPEELGNAPEIGVHAGSPIAANEVAGTGINSYTTNRVYPLVMRAENPLELPDLGHWGPDMMVEGLVDRYSNIFSPEDLKNVGYTKNEMGHFRTELPEASAIRNLRNLIRSKGYDSIKYKNTVEDPGHTSYIALDPNQLRSPWAAFKDLESRNLLSGLAGGAVAAPALTPQIQDYVRALNK